MKYTTTFAQLYSQGRPEYPIEVIRDILNGFPMGCQVADLGAGTGIGAYQLAAVGAKVWAVEPQLAMQDNGKTHPHITWVLGQAEEVPLAEQSVDIVTAFQAFHWFDFRRSLCECCRVLKPQGRLALVWNFWHQKDPVSRAYTQFVYQLFLEATGQQPIFKHYRTVWEHVDYWLFWNQIRIPHFRGLQRHTYTFKQALSFAQLVALTMSQEFIFSTHLEKSFVAEKLQSLFPDHRKDDEIILTYVTYLYLARRP